MRDPSGASRRAGGLATRGSAAADSIWEPLHASGIPTVFFLSSEILADL